MAHNPATIDALWLEWDSRFADGSWTVVHTFHSEGHKHPEGWDHIDADGMVKDRYEVNGIVVEVENSKSGDTGIWYCTIKSMDLPVGEGPRWEKFMIWLAEEATGRDLTTREYGYHFRNKASVEAVFDDVVVIQQRYGVNT